MTKNLMFFILMRRNMIPLDICTLYSVHCTAKVYKYRILREIFKQMKNWHLYMYVLYTYIVYVHAKFGLVP